MKNKMIIFVALLALTSIIAATLPGSSNNCSFVQLKASGLITPEEEQALTYMREEEKLAHDVYTFMNNKYDHKVFRNISSAETRHGGFVKELLDRYSVADPSDGKKEGEFTNSDLAAVYTRLTEKGGISLNEAFKCGAEIEELDISDLNKRIDQSTSPDVKQTLMNLRDGSYRHLQAFMRNLKANGESYTPVHLTQAQFDEILSSDNTKGYRCGDCPQGKNKNSQGNGNCDGTGPKNKNNQGNGNCDGTGPNGKNSQGNGNCDGTGPKGKNR